MKAKQKRLKGERGEASEPGQNAASPILYFCPQTPVVNLKKLSLADYKYLNINLIIYS